MNAIPWGNGLGWDVDCDTVAIGPESLVCCIESACGDLVKLMEFDLSEDPMKCHALTKRFATFRPKESYNALGILMPLKPERFESGQQNALAEAER